VYAGVNLAIWPVGGWEERLPAVLEPLVRQSLEEAKTRR
jgi:hypothetical protein